MNKLEQDVVAPQFVLDILQGAIKNKLNINELIGDIVSLEALCSEENAPNISLNQYYRIVRRLMVALDDEFIGMLNRPIPRKTFAAWCYAVNGCNNLFEIIDYSNLFISLFTDQLKWSYSVVNEQDIKLVLHTKGIEEQCARFMTLSLMIIPIRVLGWFISENIRIKTVSMRFSQHASDVRNLSHLLDSTLLFDASENAIVFDKRYATERVMSTHQQVQLFLKDTRGLLLLRQLFCPFSKRVREVIQDSYVAQGRWLTVTELGEVLHLEAASIKKKLKQEHNSYRRIINDEKEKVAKQLLLRSDLSLSDISVRMGYSELSGFYKAFVSWTGISPGDFRRV